MYENKACELLDISTPELIWSIINLHGVRMSNTAVHSVINDEIVTCTKSKVLKTLNIKDACWILTHNVGFDLDFRFVQQLHETLCDKLHESGGFIRSSQITTYYGYTPETLYVDSVILRLVDLKTIKDPIERALETFLFICKYHIFERENYAVAMLLANKVLVDNNIGIMVIPVPEQEYFHELLHDYCTGETELAEQEIKTYLKRNCIRNVK